MSISPSDLKVDTLKASGYVPQEDSFVRLLMSLYVELVASTSTLQTAQFD